MTEGRDGSYGTRRVQLSFAIPLLAAAALALAALTLIVTLTWHASNRRDDKDTIDAVTISFTQLQGLPWKLGGETSAASVRREINRAEQTITTEIERLRRHSPLPEFAGIDRPLSQTFSLERSILSLIEHHQIARTGPLRLAAARSSDAVRTALDRAGSTYLRRARGTLWRVSIGSAAVVLTLLLGFVFFYRRAFRARSAAEDLAAKLRRSQAHLELAQQLSGVGSWEWHEAARTLTWSSQMARLHAWTQPEPPATIEGIHGLVDCEDRALVRAAMHAAITDGAPLSLEYHVTRGDRRRLIHLQGARVDFHDGRASGLIGTCQDVTDRFRRAEAERANQAKNQFISRMSHELRTPLNAIIGFGQLMSMTELEPQQQTNVAHILTAGDHLLYLINEILDISQIESGDLRVSLEPTSLSEVVDGAIDLVAPIAAERNVGIRTRLSDDQQLALADPKRLTQVLLNLLSNAVKYNHPGGRVEIRSHRGNHGGVAIVVSDDGPGISSEMIERLFSPFERLGAEHTNVEGTGLGLAVSRGMVEAMGGTIGVDSRAGFGATFTIELGRCERAEPPVIEAPAVA